MGTDCKFFEELEGVDINWKLAFYVLGVIEEVDVWMWELAFIEIAII